MNPHRAPFRPSVWALLGCVLILISGAPERAAAESASTRSPLQPLATAFREALEVPALAIGVISPERIDVAAAGVRRLGSGAPVTHYDAFHSGSLAKAMLATAVAREVERGRVRWDTTVGEIFPELVATGAHAYAAVTLDDLLRHRSGLLALDDAAAVAQVPAFTGSPRAQRAQFSAWVLRQKPAAPPRTQALYSNAGYVVAAALVERISGRPFESWIESRLYSPLDMAVSYSWPASCESRNAAPWGHEYVDGRYVPRAPEWRPAVIPAWLRPAAGVSVAPRDLARFVQLHLRGLRGEARLLDASTFQHLHSPVDGFGLGWQVAEIEGHRISTLLGASGLFAAAMWIDPAKRLAGIAMTNADSDVVQSGVQQIAAALASGAAPQP